jgi:galactoside O-acetyltransferase
MFDSTLRSHGEAQVGASTSVDPETLGFAACGSDVIIDQGARFFGASHISLGSHVRIDTFAIITAGPRPVVVGDYVHIAAGAYLFGTAGIELEAFSELSSHAIVYSASDDFTDGYLSNPTVPTRYRKVSEGHVTLRRHTVVGAGAVILPGVTLGRGCAVGALTLVKRDVAPYAIVVGQPSRQVGIRDASRLADLEQQLLKDQ